MSNTMFNNAAFSFGKLQQMSLPAPTKHPSLERLLSFARETSSVSGHADLAGSLLESEQTVTNWAKRGVSKAGAMKAQAKFGCSANWLLTGALPKLAHTSDSIASNIAPAAIGRNRIPLIDYVQAGMWTAVADTFQPGDADEWLLTDLELSSSAFALQIKGDSMAPEFNEGDRVIIDPDVSPQAGDYVVAKNGGEEATFKKYRVRGQDEAGNTVFELIPLNQDYAPMRSDQQPIQIVGTMVEHRKYRKKR